MVKIMDDWYWFLICNWMVLFQPFRYMDFINKIRRGKKKRLQKDRMEERKD